MLALCYLEPTLHLFWGVWFFFFYFWLCRVFVALHELYRAAASGASSPAAVHRLPAAASLVVFRLSSCGA